MTLVVDNSVALAWTLKDEGSGASDRLLDQVMRAGAHVPFIFRAEFANGLTMAVRRSRIDPSDRAEALVFVENLHLMHDPADAAVIAKAVELADAHLLTVYDALYLELARRKRLPLATFDKQLAGAARTAGVPLDAGVEGEGRT